MREFFQVEEDTSFQRVAESFYRIVAADCSGTNNAISFFSGEEPNWATIRDEVAPYRDAFEPLLEALFDDLAYPHHNPSLYLITGAAGTGKTTLVRSIAFYIAREFGAPVLYHIPGTPLDIAAITPMVTEKNPERIVLVVNHAAEVIPALERFMQDAKQRSVPVSVVLEERRNQWNFATSFLRSRLTPTAEFELGALSGNEIKSILHSLAKHRALGKLTGSDFQYQVEHFTALSQKELLVALRELTMGNSFDNIVKDEYQRIPSPVAQEAYVYVAAIGQFDFAVRYETLVHILDVRYDQLRNMIFTPTTGVLISSEATGYSRHNEGFRLRARHPIIASIVFAMVAPDDNAKFEIINRLLTQLDTGYAEDYRLLSQISRRRDIIGIFASADVRRALYERLETLLPDDPYVLQHRSIIERDLGNPTLALQYARDAVRMEPQNAAFLSTLGFALEFSARSTSDPFRVSSMLAEASRLFNDAVQRNVRDPYGYVGQVNVLRQKVDREPDNSVKAVLRAQMLSLLEEAYEVTDGHEIIANVLAEQRQQVGETKDAINILQTALTKNPTDTRLRDLWVRYEMKAGNYEKALQIAQDGVKFDPTSWRLQQHIARLLKLRNAPVDAIKGHYVAAIRHHRGDINLLVEFGAFLFIHGIRDEAASIFSTAQQLPIESKERQKIREYWKAENGKDKRFTGKLKRVRSIGGSVIAVPENFEAFFPRNSIETLRLREGDSLTFIVGFNAYGAIARSF